MKGQHVEVLLKSIRQAAPDRIGYDGCLRRVEEQRAAGTVQSLLVNLSASLAPLGSPQPRPIHDSPSLDCGVLVRTARGNLFHPYAQGFMFTELWIWTNGSPWIS